uniref:Protein NRT1/ PTR FAMILY 6.2-like n=1 Tax=Tanacetum cinerariifolium TaxID=118510 RepID=A0A699HCN2_TANCI|nr:protein NRT1/ PTR FAMILY 6.2-like [Tanacetum cinerariifolium]
MEGKANLTVSDAVDYKGFPADRSKTGGWVPAALILGIEICERLSTMGIAVNLVTYLGGTMHLSSSASANVVTDFMGTSFLLCLLGGFLADSFLGRFKTIVIFASIQTLGTAALALSTKLPQLRPPPCLSSENCKEANGFQMGILYLALYLIAVGTGGLKSSVSGFGTDQFDEKNEEEKTQMAYFFNRFFFFISLGTLMAVTVLVYIQDEVGRSWAYGICSVSMFTAILVILYGTKRYRYKKSAGSPIVQIFQVIVAAIKKRRMDLPYDYGLLYENSPEGSRIHHTNQFRCLDKAAIVAEDDFEKNTSSSRNPWKLCTVTRVEEVKMMVRLLPVWATTILFWTTYAQMITFSVEQAATMQRTVSGFQIPAGSLTVFFVAAILLTCAVYDCLIIPLWKKWKGTPGFTDLQRIALGLALSTLGMAAAAVFEIKRLSVARRHPLPTSEALPISVFILIPQFFLVGSGEAFIYTGQLDFFITRSPKGMKTMSTGLFLTTLSLGFFMSSFLVSVVKKVTGNNGENGWLADNINNGRLDLFYGLLALLSGINFLAFLVCAAWCKKDKGKTSASHYVQTSSPHTADSASKSRHTASLSRYPALTSKEGHPSMDTRGSIMIQTTRKRVINPTRVTLRTSQQETPTREMSPRPSMPTTGEYYLGGPSAPTFARLSEVHVAESYEPRCAPHWIPQDASRVPRVATVEHGSSMTLQGLRRMQYLAAKVRDYKARVRSVDIAKEAKMSSMRFLSVCLSVGILVLALGQVDCFVANILDYDLFSALNGWFIIPFPPQYHRHQTLIAARAATQPSPKLTTATKPPPHLTTAAHRLIQFQPSHQPQILSSNTRNCNLVIDLCKGRTTNGLNHGGGDGKEMVEGDVE